MHEEAFRTIKQPPTGKTMARLGTYHEAKRLSMNTGRFLEIVPANVLGSATSSGAPPCVREGATDDAQVYTVPSGAPPCAKVGSRGVQQAPVPGPVNTALAAGVRPSSRSSAITQQRIPLDLTLP